MKTGLHPQTFDTQVHCNGCNTEFVTHSTVPEITVEICSNCHPFYTGKQKLVDTAGRVDRFNARRQAAAARQSAATPKKPRKSNAPDAEMAAIDAELEAETVELPAAEAAPAADAAPATGENAASSES